MALLLASSKLGSSKYRKSTQLAQPNSKTSWVTEEQGGRRSGGLQGQSANHYEVLRASIPTTCLREKVCLSRLICVSFTHIQHHGRALHSHFRFRHSFSIKLGCIALGFSKSLFSFLTVFCLFVSFSVSFLPHHPSPYLPPLLLHLFVMLYPSYANMNGSFIL